MYSINPDDDAPVVDIPLNDNTFLILYLFTSVEMHAFIDEERIMNGYLMGKRIVF